MTKIYNYIEFITEDRLKGKVIEYTENVDKVVANFKKDNKQSKNAKKLMEDFLDIKQQVDALAVKQKALSTSIKDLGTELFDASDKFLTRVVRVSGFVATISKQSESKSTDYEAAYKALVEKLNPEIKVMADAILEKFTNAKLTAEKLSSVKKDSVKESFELNEGIKDVLKKWYTFIKDWYKEFKVWEKNFDKEYEALISLKQSKEY